MRFVSEDGVALADVALEILGGSTSRTTRTDSTGLAVLALEEGPYDVRFLDVPVRMPAAVEPVEVRRDLLVERALEERVAA